MRESQLLDTICPVHGEPVSISWVQGKSGIKPVHCSYWDTHLLTGCSMVCLRQVALEVALAQARQVQTILEPPHSLRLDEVRMATVLRVSRNLGGDFLSVHTMPRLLRLLLGDVVGKGIQAAVLAAFLQGMYEQLAHEPLRPGEILTELNLSLTSRHHADVLFATLACLDVDLEDRTWRVARAGHESPLLVRRGGAVLELDPGPALPAGVDVHERYRDLRLPLATGDRLCVGSDGLDEVGVAREDLVGLLRSGEGEAIDLLEQLLARVPEAAPLRDDLTAAVLTVGEAA